MAIENLTVGWVETDPDGVLTVTSTRVTNNGTSTSPHTLTLSAATAGVTAFGAGYGDLEFLFETVVTDVTGRPVAIGFCDSALSLDVLLEETEAYDGIWWTHRDGNTDVDIEPGSWLSSTLVEPNPDADVVLSSLAYGKLTFNDTTDEWLLEYFSNALRTTALGSPTALSCSVAFSHMHIGDGNSFRGDPINYYIQNLDLQLAPAGPVTKTYVPTGGITSGGAATTLFNSVVETYAEALDNLSPVARYPLDGDAVDAVGIADGTNSGGVYTGPAICEGVTNSWVTNGTTDRIVLPSGDPNTTYMSRKTMGGWFSVTGIQNPPKNIFGEGDATSAFRFILGWGNYLVYEVDAGTFTIQIFGDTPLEIDRPYHLMLKFSGPTYDDMIYAYLDGVLQTNSEPVSRAPGADMSTRTAGEFGDPAGTVAVGGTTVVLLAPINGNYNEWVSWGGAEADALTTTIIREEVFEKGALPSVTISTGTEAAMQAELDTYADSIRPNQTLCFRVDDIAGGGDLSLSADNIIFDPLASIHIQWMGAGTLNWTNTNGSNTSIGSTPSGGTLNIQETVTILITAKDVNDFALIEGAAVYIKADTGGPLLVGTEILKDVTNASGIVSLPYSYTADQPVVGVVRRGTTTPLYKTGQISGTINSGGLNQTILLIPDE